MALTFLPPNEVRNALNELHDDAPLQIRLQGIDDMHAYFNRQWMQPAIIEIWNMHGVAR